MLDIKCHRGEAAPLDKQPFLTIVTRAYKKPNCLRRCIASVEMQTDPDYEHIILEDKVGQGLAWADCLLGEKKELNHGKFIMVLDDDDEITNRGFITLLKFLDQHFNPDLIIWRGYFSEVDFSLPPIDHRFGTIPARGLIGSFNYCSKKELYDKHVHLCKSGIAGDYDFLLAMFQEVPKDKVHWLRKILVRTQQKSFGKAMDRKGT